MHFHANLNMWCSTSRGRDFAREVNSEIFTWCKIRVFSHHLSKLIQGFRILQLNDQNVLLFSLLFSEGFHLYLRKPTAAKSPVLHPIWAGKKWISKNVGEKFGILYLLSALDTHVERIKGSCCCLKGTIIDCLWSRNVFKTLQKYRRISVNHNM